MEVRSRKSEVGTQKSELRSRNSEVGTQKWPSSAIVVIGRMSEDDFPTEKIQELQHELEALSMFHENMEQKLSEIHTMVKKQFRRQK